MIIKIGGVCILLKTFTSELLIKRKVWADCFSYSTAKIYSDSSIQQINCITLICDLLTRSYQPSGIPPKPSGCPYWHLYGWRREAGGRLWCRSPSQQCTAAEKTGLLQLLLSSSLTGFVREACGQIHASMQSYKHCNLSNHVHLGMEILYLSIRLFRCWALLLFPSETSRGIGISSEGNIGVKT